MVNIEEVQQWLQHRHQVQVPDDWLHACLEWIQEEHEGQVLESGEVKQMVYDQWLVCDLEEIGASCLPPGLTQQEKHVLTGTYCLQMVSLLDISVPYYSQLKKLEGVENENVLVSATQPTQQSPKDPKKNRMLMMKLTDGQQQVHGMEHQPIPLLHTNLVPGTKLLIQGSVLCRLGAMMLKKENVCILGGEVDTLMEENTQLNLLRNALGHSEQLTQQPPRVEKKEFNTQPLGSSSMKHANVVGEQQRLGAGQASNKQYQPQYQQQQPKQPQWNQPGGEARTGAVDEDEDFLDYMDTAQLDALQEQWDEDVDDDVLLSQWAYQDQQEQPKLQQEQYHQQQSQHQQRAQQQSRTTPQQLPQWQQPKQPTYTSQRQEQMPFKKDAESAAADVVFDDVMDTFEDEEDDFDVPVRNRISQNLFADRDNKKPRLSSSSNKLSKPKLCSGASHPKDNNIPTVSHPGGSNIHIVDTSGITVKPEPKLPSIERSSEKLLSSSSIQTIHPNKKIKVESPEVIILSEELEENLPDIKPDIQHDMKPDIKPPVKQPAIDLFTPPFTYLALAMQHWPPTETVYVCVKAYISTVLGKLESNSGQQWSLMVKLNDGTAAVDVDLGDKMLSSLIGFTALECMKMKAMSKEDKSLKKKMVQGIQQCQHSLVQLSCLMEVELSRHRPHPYVTRYIQMNSDHVALLRGRSAR